MVTETEIIDGCFRANPTYQRLLFNKYSPLLITVCLRYAMDSTSAEDMLQEAFIRIFSSIHQYRFEGSFEGWLRAVTVRACLRKLEQVNIKYDDTSTLETISDSLEPSAISALTEKELVKLINNLPDGYRVVFNLHVIEGYTHEEIAAMLNIAEVTSRTQLLKARRLLQKQILSCRKICFKHE